MHTTRTIVLSVALVITSTAVAVADSGRDEHLAGDNWEASIGVQGSPGMDIGTIEAHEPVGLHLAAGRQFDSVRVAADYTLVSFSGCIGSERVAGQVHRVGLSGRYRILFGTGGGAFDDGFAVSTGLYVGAGIGRQSLRLEGGGVDARTDAMLEVGWELVFGDEQFGGIDFGLRVLAAPSGAIADEQPHGSMEVREDHTTDLTALLQLSLLFGR